MAQQSNPVHASSVGPHNSHFFDAALCQIWFVKLVIRSVTAWDPQMVCHQKSLGTNAVWQCCSNRVPQGPLE